MTERKLGAEALANVERGSRTETMEPSDVAHWIAQGAINIAEESEPAPRGYSLAGAFFETGSPTHLAMMDFSTLWAEGKIVVEGMPPPEKAGER